MLHCCSNGGVDQNQLFHPGAQRLVLSRIIASLHAEKDEVGWRYKAFGSVTPSLRLSPLNHRMLPPVMCRPSPSVHFSSEVLDLWWFVLLGRDSFFHTWTPLATTQFRFVAENMHHPETFWGPAVSASAWAAERESVAFSHFPSRPETCGHAAM